jgi:hypothetical protein
MTGDAFVWLAAAGAVGSVALLRIGWARPRRSAGLNAAGWLALALATAFAWAGAGMWGVSIATLAGMSAAAALLALAAARSPRGKASASNRRVRMLPERGERLRIGGRLLTFAIAAPLGLTLAVGLGVALRGLVMALGGSEANANALGLLLPPLAWGVIAWLLLIQQRRRAQALIVLACALPVIPLVIGTAL